MNKVAVSINCGFSKELVAKDAGGQEIVVSSQEHRAKRSTLHPPPKAERQPFDQ
jgi:hypothetical protein